MRPNSPYLPPIIIQIVGVLIIVAVLVGWLLFDREAPLLIAAGVTLAMLGGSYERARYELHRVLRPPEEKDQS